MKKGFVISVLMLVVIGYVYFFEFSVSQEEKVERIKKDQIAASEGLQEIRIEVPQQKAITLISSRGRWWLEEPVNYPAQPGLMEQNLTVMGRILADTHFPYENDNFGFASYAGKLQLTYKNGDEKNLVLGSQKAPGNKVFVLSEKNQTVYVVNNVWAQFFYKNYKEYMVKDLYIPYKEIQKAKFSDKALKGWSVEKEGENWIYEEESLKTTIRKKPIGGLMRALLKVKVTEVLFGQKDLDDFYTLSLWMKDGRKLDFNITKGKNLIFLPHLKVIAKVEPSSVRYFINEIRKAGQNGDKN